MSVNDTEKAPHHEQIERAISEDTNDARIAEFSPAEQKKILRRVDLRLVTVLGLLYMCSLMDRTNLGAANIAGYALSLCPIAQATNVNNRSAVWQRVSNLLVTDIVLLFSSSSFLTFCSSLLPRSCCGKSALVHFCQLLLYSGVHA